MNVQITRFSLFQTAKVVGGLYFVAACVGALLFFLMSLVSPASRPPYGLLVIVLSPFI